MSIEMENPKTVVEKVDAAANLVQQMWMAHRIGDEVNFNKAHMKAGDFLFRALQQLEDNNEGNTPEKP